MRENELTLDSVVKNYFITAADGKSYEVTFYSLDMVLAVGFRVKGKRGTQFRIWANQHLKNKDVLRNAGTISNKEMEAHVQTVYEQFNNRRKKTEAMLADQMDDEELKLLEQQIRERK